MRLPSTRRASTRVPRQGAAGAVGADEGPASRRARPARPCSSTSSSPRCRRKAVDAPVRLDRRESEITTAEWGQPREELGRCLARTLYKATVFVSGAGCPLVSPKPGHDAARRWRSALSRCTSRRARRQRPPPAHPRLRPTSTGASRTPASLPHVHQSGTHVSWPRNCRSPHARAEPASLLAPRRQSSRCCSSSARPGGGHSGAGASAAAAAPSSCRRRGRRQGRRGEENATENHRGRRGGGQEPARCTLHSHVTAHRTRRPGRRRRLFPSDRRFLTNERRRDQAAEQADTGTGDDGDERVAADREAVDARYVAQLVFNRRRVVDDVAGVAGGGDAATASAATAAKWTVPTPFVQRDDPSSSYAVSPGARQMDGDRPFGRG